MWIFEFTQSTNNLIDKSHFFYSLLLSLIIHCLHVWLYLTFDLTVQYSVQFPFAN